MAKRRQDAEGGALATLRAKAGKRSGFVRVVLQVMPEHLQALVTEARKRVDARGGVRADTSAVAREALEAWMRKRAK